MPSPSKSRKTSPKQSRQASAGKADAGKLAAYQRKRDFGRTPEPAGAPPQERAADAPGSWCSATEPAGVHYDLRFEIDGVLVSWAVPKGPTLDPNVRRTAIHVEDHPIEYLDFEGIIPAGEYGGGDVIVWDQGTWEPHATDDPAAAVAAATSTPTSAGRSCAAGLILVAPRPTVTRRRTSGCCCTSTTTSPSTAGTRRSTRGRCSAAAPTTRSRPTRTGCGAATCRPPQASIAIGEAAPSGPDPAELDALDALPGSGGTWEVFGRRLKVTNLDKAIFPGRDGEEPITKREFIGYAARIAHTVLPYLEGRALNMNRFPGGADTEGFWHKQLPEHAPDWLPRWDNPDADRGDATTLPGRGRAGRAGVGGQLRRAGMARLDRAHGPAGHADLRAHRYRPGPGHHLG